MSRYGILAALLLLTAACSEEAQQLAAYDECRDQLRPDYRPEGVDGAIEAWPQAQVCVIPQEAALYFQEEHVARRAELGR